MWGSQRHLSLWEEHYIEENFDKLGLVKWHQTRHRYFSLFGASTNWSEGKHDHQENNNLPYLKWGRDKQPGQWNLTSCNWHNKGEWTKITLWRCGKAWRKTFPDSKVHGSNMGPTWGRQDPGVPHVGPMNFAIWAMIPLPPSRSGQRNLPVLETRTRHQRPIKRHGDSAANNFSRLCSLKHAMLSSISTRSYNFQVTGCCLVTSVWCYFIGEMQKCLSYDIRETEIFRWVKRRARTL